MHGAPLRRIGRRDIHYFRIHRRARTESDIRAGLGRRHRPRRIRAGDLRPEQGFIREAARRLLAQHRSARGRPAVLRRRVPVSKRNLLFHARAAGVGRSVEAEGAGRIRQADRHPDRSGRSFLSGRGVSPGLLPQESAALQVLPPEMRTRSAAGTVVGTAQREAAIGPLDRAHASHCPPFG